MTFKNRASHHLQLVALCVMLCMTPLSAHAASKLALVLESGDTPQSDVDIKSTLKENGFSVFSPGIVNADGIEWALGLFQKKLKRLGPEATALVYVRTFAASLDGENILLPALSPIKQPDDVAANGYRLHDLYERLSSSEVSEIGVALDICHEVKDIEGIRATERIVPPDRFLVMDCSLPSGTQVDGAMASLFVESIGVGKTGLADAFAYFSENVDTAGTVVANADTVADAPKKRLRDTGDQTYAEGLDEILWNSIKDTSDPAALEEYLLRFPDGDYVDAAKTRLAALATQKEATQEEAAQMATGQATVEKPTVTAEAPVEQPETQVAALQQIEPAPTKTEPTSVDPASLSASMSGTDNLGWGSIYTKDCGSAVRYHLDLTNHQGMWRGDMKRLSDGMTIRFVQRDRPTKTGIVLLYASVEGAKATLKVTPSASGKATYSIPTAGIGSCAVGYLD